MDVFQTLMRDEFVLVLREHSRASLICHCCMRQLNTGVYNV